VTRLQHTMDSELIYAQGLPSIGISRLSRRQNNRLSVLRSLMHVFLVSGVAFSLEARADYWFKVNDASQIQYFVNSTPNSTQIYLRNLNTFDSTVLGCCFNYWVDISTDLGKAIWATLLAKIQAQQPIWIYITSQTAAGPVTVAWFG
jgi:hypothetical protein